tara:strand:- start:528 stop:959 length:432 start_codon:yes stop_codon:yes gene_type:complete
MAFSDYLEDAILKHIFTNTSYTSPSIYVGLLTAAPTDSNTGATVTEVPSSNAYSREQVSNWTVSGTSPTEASNTAAIEFTTATGNWGTVSHVGLFDNATVGQGNLLAYVNLSDPNNASLAVTKTIQNGDVFRILATKLSVRLD